ncbi:MAG: site-2 protease family protein [Clostridium sp.]
MNHDIAQFIITGIVIVISLTFHEYAHALASYSQGDSTAKAEGRLTLNPFSHIDIFGLLMLFIVSFGWAKPVPINSYFYKNPRRGIIITSFAGPFANLILAFITCFVYTILVKNNYMPSEGIFIFFQTMIGLNINLAIFNLLPIPPLDGSKIFAEAFGGKVAEIIYKIDGKGMIILFLLLMLPFTRSILSFISNSIIMFMLNIINLIV